MTPAPPTLPKLTPLPAAAGIPGAPAMPGISNLPAAPSLPQMPTTEIWTSEELQFLVRSLVTDPGTGTSCVTDMKNIKPGVQFDPGMFQVPPDFRIATPAAPALPIRT